MKNTLNLVQPIERSESRLYCDISNNATNIEGIGRHQGKSFLIKALFCILVFAISLCGFLIVY